MENNNNNEQFETQAPQDVSQPQEPVAPQEVPQPQEPVAPQEPVQAQEPQQPVAPQQPVQPQYQQPAQPQYQQPVQPQYQQPVQPQYAQPVQPQYVQTYDPTTAVMSVGSYIGMFILSAIPIVNIICWIVWLVSPNTNKNKKNYCIATIVLWAIGVVLSIIVSIIASAAGVNVLSSF